MAALFDMGLLEQPHTSAGRIPSHLGYRVYIDSLMRCDPLTQHERDELDALFNVGDPDPDRLIEDATERLAQYTGCATVSVTMTARSVYVKRVGPVSYTHLGRGEGLRIALQLVERLLEGNFFGHLLILQALCGPSFS